MKKFFVAALAILILFYFSACENQQQRGERLAIIYCGSCHAFPSPNLLDKETWENGVLPQMAFRMGRDFTLLSSISKEDQSEALTAIPDNALLSEEEWEAIKNYYLQNAPDSIVAPIANIEQTIHQFKITPLRLPIRYSPLATLVKTDTLNHKTYVGNWQGRLYQLNEKLALEDSFQLASEPSQIIFHRNEDPMLLLMGIMNPNDQAKGGLIQLKTSDRSSSTLIDSLKRPVYVERTNLNADTREDYIICAFGNYTGALLAYENMGDGKFIKHALINFPGARKVVVKDFDNNGLMDILVLMAQGDEKIVMLYNQGNFDFRVATLLRFPPVYGSSYFDVADFNNDGKFDILYTNGDNSDYSKILKPYHGVRLFLNDGTNQFTESWFYPMHGASQAIAHDFDKDGDLDIAAISFFPDFKTHAEQGFIYFENTGKHFVPQISRLGSSGRWITMDVSDFDTDGDKDVILGALNFDTGVPDELSKRWINQKTDLLILRNNLH